MHYRFVSVIAVTINMMLHSTHSRLARRNNRHENGDVFNLLLGLYKVNPLKNSQIYQTFSEGVLSGHPESKRIDIMQFASNENKKKQVKLNLKEIEKVIHVKHNKARRVMAKPEYDIEDVDTENFNADIMLNDRISKEKIKFGLEDDNFSGLFAHIGSNELEGDDGLDGDIPVTKLLPVNDNVIKTPSTSENFKINNDYSIGITPDKTKGVEKLTKSYVNVANDIQSETVMTDKFDTADVIVI